MPRVHPKPQFAILRGLALAIEGLNALDKLCPVGYQPLQAEARMIRDAFATRKGAIEAMSKHCETVARIPSPEEVDAAIDKGCERSRIQAGLGEPNKPVWCEHITWQFIGSRSHGGGMGWMIQNAPEFALIFVDVHWTCCPICKKDKPAAEIVGVPAIDTSVPPITKESAEDRYRRTLPPEVHEALAAVMMAINAMHQSMVSLGRWSEVPTMTIGSSLDADEAYIKDAILKVGKLKALTIEPVKPGPRMVDPDCSNYLRQVGQPYPRTCKVCQLGPCHFTSEDIAIVL